MADILVDNWTMETAVKNSIEIYTHWAKPHPDYIRLIEAIILWDNIYYVDNEYSENWKKLLHYFDCADFIHPITDLEDDNMDLYIGQAKELSILNGTDIVSGGAIEYCALADLLCMSYLPTGRRIEYIEKQQLENNVIDRKDIMTIFDKNVLEYYDEINKKIGNNKLQFEFPTLFRYVQDHAEKATLIETAMKMKTFNDVREFRNYLDQVELDFKQGDIKAMEKCLDEIPKLVTSMKKSLQIQLGGSMQINFGLGGITAVTPKININLNLPSIKGKHINFLRRLAKYAQRGRD